MKLIILSLLDLKFTLPDEVFLPTILSWEDYYDTFDRLETVGGVDFRDK
jgi:hypothetical protein